MSSPPQATIEQFNESAVVRIVKFDTVPEATPQQHHVEFEVRITTNTRVGIFMADVDSSSASSNQEIVDLAWTSVKTHVNDWFCFNILHEPFTTFTVTDTTDALSADDFNAYFTVSISRFELYPSVNPNAWCIAFVIKMNSNPMTNIYLEGQTSTTTWCNNVRCVAVASAVWEQVMDRACVWAADHMSKPVVLNTTYIPSEI